MGRIYSRSETGAIDTVERERPPVAHHATHIDRDAETERGDAHPESNPMKWVNPTNLDAPKPRANFVQRWIRDPGQQGSPTENNWMKRMREGWRPREPETISESERALYPSAKIVGVNSDVIRVAGLVLCEMPKQIAAQRYGAMRDSVARQKESVPPSAQEMMERGRRPGLGPVQQTDHEAVYNGRRIDPMTD